MKFAFAAVLSLLVGGYALAGCPVRGGYAQQYYAPTYYLPTYINLVEFSFAHPVFNEVDVVTIQERQVFVPTVVTDKFITQDEAITKTNVIAVNRAYGQRVKGY
jgi:hypothetical protein